MIIKTTFQNAIPLNDEWKDIPSFENVYKIHWRGYVRSLLSGKILKAGKTTGGYLTVALLGKTYPIHRLVGLNFISNNENKRCVNHKDGNKLNNHISNLEWSTHSENMIHAFRMGLSIPLHKMEGVDNYRYKQ